MNPPSLSSSTKRGVLYIVATPIGNLEDVTYRAVRVLGEVAIVAAEDTRRTSRLLKHYGIQIPTLSFHEHNENLRTPKLLTALESGESVALVSDAGTPLLSDPGAGLVKAALSRGIKVSPLPGASAVLAALVASGRAGTRFTFVGFPPNRSMARQKWFRSLPMDQGPLVVFESPHRLICSLTDLLAVLGDLDIVICRELTKIHEEFVIGPISRVLQRITRPRGEFTIIISPGVKEENPPTNESIIDEFCRLTKYMPSRRDAVTAIARSHRLSARTVYQIVEDGKP